MVLNRHGLNVHMILHLSSVGIERNEQGYIVNLDTSVIIIEKIAYLEGNLRVFHRKDSKLNHICEDLR